jgi:pimeloyl-ACP methyl ester carboxylesterase
VRRGARIALAIVAALAILLAVNAIVVDRQTKGAGSTVDGGRILHLPGGDVQVVSDGPRAGRPIVLVHCFACSLRWWDRVVPLLGRDHRVIRIDLLGFGGSEKPRDGYSIEQQGRLVAAAMRELQARRAVVVGHSMGFGVATALAAQSSGLVDRLVNIDEQPSPGYGGLPLLARLGFTPAIGEAIWRATPDFAIVDGYRSAFAPGYELGAFEDQLIDDFRAMTYTSYDRSHAELDDYGGTEPLDARVRSAGVPLLVVFGTEDQLYDDPRRTADAYRSVPGAEIRMIPGAGHSPNVERPARTARLILEFARGQPLGAST